MKRSLPVAVLGLATALVLCTACTRKGALSDSTPIRVGYLPVSACLPYFAAEQQNFFKKEGVRAEEVKFASGQQMMDALLQGKIDVALSVATADALLAEEKSPGQVKVFGVTTNGAANPLEALMVKSGSPLRAVRDLRGKKIGVPPGPQATSLLKRFLRVSGVDPKSVVLQELSQDQQVQALDSGAVDALLAFEPTLSIARSKGVGGILVSSPFSRVTIDPYPSGVFAFSQTFLSQHAEVGAAALRAFGAAISYLDANPASARSLLAAANAAELSAPGMPLPRFERSQSMNAAAYQRLADILREEGVLTKTVNATSMVLQ